MTKEIKPENPNTEAAKTDEGKEGAAEKVSGRKTLRPFVRAGRKSAGWRGI